MALQNKLKAFVRFDGSGRVIPSSLILQKSKPKVGNWKEINATQCCNDTPTTTTTTTIAVNSQNFAAGFILGNVCGTSAITPIYYTGALGNGSSLYMDAGLTTPYNQGLSGTYIKLYFAAEDQLCTMNGNIIQSYTACSGITTTTTTTTV